MPLKNKSESESAKLRCRAEKRVANQPKTAASPAGSKDPRRLVHELEVHQIELELQNEELRQAKAQIEANYDELYDFAPVGYFTLGRYGDIEKSNLTGAGMLGQPRAQLLGRRLAGFVAPESLPCFNAFLRRVMGGCDKESCVVALIKDRNTPVTAYIEAYGAGQDSSCRAVVMDITAAEQARRALRESEERLRLALDASSMGVWEWERDSVDIYWSPECSRIFGVNSICPTLDSLAPLLHPEDAERVIATLRRMLADGKEQSVNCRIIRPNGQAAWVSARGQVQHDKAGKPLRLMGIAQEITERKHVDESSGRGPV